MAERCAVVVTGALGMGFAYLAMAPLQLSADGASLAGAAIALGVFVGLVVVLHGALPPARAPERGFDLGGGETTSVVTAGLCFVLRDLS